LATERAYNKMLKANEDFKKETMLKVQRKNDLLEERLKVLKKNRHRQSNPELQG